MDGSTTRNKSFYLWRLPKPLFVPPGSVLNASISRLAADGWSLDDTDALPVTIAYACRALPQGTPVPREIAVPYVGVWVDDLGGTNETNSGDNLKNPFQLPLHVQRFVGRLRQYYADGTNASDRENDFSSSTDFTVAMKDSNGRDLIRDLLAFNEVFDLQTRSWLCPFTLGPRERIIARVGGKVTATSTTLEPIISMIGYRFEPAGDL